jgi:catechol-2,3-dioxygenase
MPSVEPPRSRPAIGAVLTMFYYDDLDRAADWYEHVLGLRRMMAAEGFVLFEVSGQAQLALVGAGYGSQRPIPGTNKGAILSIQTSELERWHADLFARNVPGTGIGLCVGGDGRTLEFKVSDPEGYTIEFFEWIE